MCSFHFLDPEQVLGLTLSQNTTSPSRGIIVSWNAEIGKGDYISVRLLYNG